MRAKLLKWMAKAAHAGINSAILGDSFLHHFLLVALELGNVLTCVFFLFLWSFFFDLPGFWCTASVISSISF